MIFKFKTYKNVLPPDKFLGYWYEVVNLGMPLEAYPHPKLLSKMKAIIQELP